MYTCTHCRRKFNNEPFISSTNNKKYCSLKCIPDDAMNKPYSFEYFNLVESIQDIEASISSINTLEERIDLEEEVNDLSTKYTIDIYGDDEGCFYKGQIFSLFPKLDELYDKIHNIFMERKLESRPSAIIRWCDLIDLIGEIAYRVFESFKGEIEQFSYENVNLVCSDTKSRYINISYYEDKLCVDSLTAANKIKRIFVGILKQYKDKLTEQQWEELEDHSYCIHVEKLYRCISCEQWELIDSFTFYEDLKVYKCDEHTFCSEYGQYYQG